MLYFSEVWSHKKNRKGDTPHLYFLEPISSLLVKTWTLVERKTAGKVCQQSEVQSWFLSPFCWHSGHGAVAGKTRDCLEPFGHWAFPRAEKLHQQQVPAWVGSMWRAAVLLHLKTKALKVWSSAQLLTLPSLPGSIDSSNSHRLLMLPRVQLDQKSRIWIGNWARDGFCLSTGQLPTASLFGLKQIRKESNTLPVLTPAGKRAALQIFTEIKRKSKANLLIFWHQALVQILWWTAPSHWLFQKSSSWGEKNNVGDQKNSGIMESYILYSFDYILGYILELKQNNNWEEDKNQS